MAQGSKNMCPYEHIRETILGVAARLMIVFNNLVVLKWVDEGGRGIFFLFLITVFDIFRTPDILGFTFIFFNFKILPLCSC